MYTINQERLYYLPKDKVEYCLNLLCEAGWAHNRSKANCKDAKIFDFSLDECSVRDLKYTSREVGEESDEVKLSKEQEERKLLKFLNDKYSSDKIDPPPPKVDPTSDDILANVEDES